MVCSWKQRKRKKCAIDIKIRGKNIEQVRYFKYLGMTLKSNGRQNRNIKEKDRKNNENLSYELKQKDSS